MDEKKQEVRSLPPASKILGIIPNLPNHPDLVMFAWSQSDEIHGALPIPRDQAIWLTRLLLREFGPLEPASDAEVQQLAVPFRHPPGG